MLKPVTDFFRSILTRYHLAILVIVSFLCAATGPFGSYADHGFLKRLVYWTLVTAASIVIGRACSLVVRRLLPKKRLMLEMLLLTGLMTVFFTPPLWLMTQWFTASSALEGPKLLKMGYYVAAISLCVGLLRQLVSELQRAGYLGSRAANLSERPRLIRRLSKEFKGPILRLSVRDHFVDVISSSNSETIRMRFADAIDEMDTVAGHCTHRSHWVAENAIVGARRNGGKVYLELVNGDQVPVSRKYRAQLKDVGIIGF